MSVKKQLLYYLFIFMLLVLLPFLFFPNFLNGLILDSAKKEAEKQADTLQNGLTRSITENQHMADKLAFFLENYDDELTKSLVENNLKKILTSQQSDVVYGGIVAFIPNKTPFGKYAPSYYRKQDGKNYKLIFTDLSSDKYDYSSKDWYKNAVNAKGEPICYFLTGKKLILTYCAPVIKNEKLIAFVTIDVLTERFKRILFTNDLSRNRYRFILTLDGNAIGLPGNSNPTLQSHKDIEQNYSADSVITFKNALRDWNSILEANTKSSLSERQSFFRLERNFFEKDSKYHAFIGYDKFIGKGKDAKSIYSIVPLQNPNSLLILVISESALLPELKMIQRIALIFIIMLFLTLLFYIFYISGKTAKPFEKLVFQTKKFSEGHLDYRIDFESKKLNTSEQPSKEIKELANAFNSMGEKLQKSFENLEETRQEILFRLLKASEHKDYDTAKHLKRINGYCSIIAKKLGFSDSQVKMLADAAMMHDVGKIGIPDNVLLKPGKLTSEEFEIMKTHTTAGKDILSGSNSALLQMAEKIASSHHEKWNGTGYPLGLKGEDIPLEGRITAVCDIFDALISKRTYKEAWSFEEAINFIKNESGVSLDPKIVDIFINSQDEIRKIVENSGNEQDAINS